MGMRNFICQQKFATICEQLPVLFDLLILIGCLLMLFLFSRVVCVGGDGIVHEVVNGLLEKLHGNVGIDLVDGTLPEKFNALPLNIRVGIIPAGASFAIFS